MTLTPKQQEEIKQKYQARKDFLAVRLAHEYHTDPDSIALALGIAQPIVQRQA